MEIGASPRQRAAILLSILVVHLLLFVQLLRQTAWQPPFREVRRLVTFQLASETPAKPTPKKNEPADEERQKPPPPRPPEPPVKATEAPPAPEVPFLALSKEVYAAADIGKLPRRAPESGTSNGPVYGPGDGPGGVQLQYAEWYRKPTDAELAFYLPPGTRSGFGTIECTTAPNYHVEKCRVIDQTPGLGLGNAVRQAAWQFLVKPPRVNGKPQIGVRVAIRIDYTRVAAGPPARARPPLPYPPPPPDAPEE